MLLKISILLKIHLDLVDHNVVSSALVWAIFIFIRRADTKPLSESIEILSNTPYECNSGDQNGKKIDD